MDLNYTPEEESFRADVRVFLAAELPAEIRDKVNLGRRLLKDDLVRWQKILHRRGWARECGRHASAEPDGASSGSISSRRRRRQPARRRNFPFRCGWWLRC